MRALARLPAASQLVQRPSCYFDKVTLLTHDESVAGRELQICKPLGIGLEPGTVAFVGGETWKCDQPPRHVVGALVRQKIPDQVAPAAGNDAAPVFSVLLKRSALKRINLVADQTGERHCRSPGNQDCGKDTGLRVGNGSSTIE